MHRRNAAVDHRDRDAASRRVPMHFIEMPEFADGLRGRQRIVGRSQHFELLHRLHRFDARIARERFDGLPRPRFRRAPRARSNPRRARASPSRCAASDHCASARRCAMRARAGVAGRVAIVAGVARFGRSWTRGGAQHHEQFRARSGGARERTAGARVARQQQGRARASRRSLRAAPAIRPSPRPAMRATRCARVRAWPGGGRRTRKAPAAFGPSTMRARFAPSNSRSCASVSARVEHDEQGVARGLRCRRRRRAS